MARTTAWEKAIRQSRECPECSSPVYYYTDPKGEPVLVNETGVVCYCPSCGWDGTRIITALPRIREGESQRRMVVHYRLGKTRWVACGNKEAIEWTSDIREVTCKRCLKSNHMMRLRR